MTGTLIVLPTFNEAENLQPMAERLLAMEPALEVLVVDDNSPDGTGEIAAGLAKVNDRVHVLHRQEKDGLGRAYCAGFAWALERGYELIFEMDCDFSHDPDDIPRFIDKANAENADLVLGSRYCEGIRVINWPISRLLLSICAARYVKTITGMPFTDPTGGFKCFRRRALQAIDLDRVLANGYSFQVELTHILWRTGHTIAEVPIIFTDRFIGTSKMSGKIVREAVWMVWRLWLQNGLRRGPRKKK
ncbi:MAG: polyprenol monophosphomannose synthase [Verrucomicrobia bacterium]|nr:polyprenol monophosphomannose synthase [Verrucomicrobiota bacterium]